MKSAMERLNQAQHKLAEAMYAKALGGARRGSRRPERRRPAGRRARRRKPDDVVDADFEEVKE